MPNELVINTMSHETRIALIENGTIAELYIERSRVKGIVGNIYKGRVIRVLPGMQAAFVDVGMEKAAFLYVADVFEAIEDFETFIDGNDKKEDEQNNDGHGLNPMHPIEDLLQEGQEILVQISKEPIGTKGARITSHISLPGRHLVYMPTVDHVGVSRRIENEVERERLKDTVERIRPNSGGFIVRTVSEGKSEDDLLADMQYLTKLWEEIVKKNEQAHAPCLIHSDLDVTQKVLRDILSEDVDRIVVDTKAEYDKVEQFLCTFMPKSKYSIDLYEENEPIFDHFGLLSQKPLPETRGLHHAT
jgi:ribonuclease G